MKMRALEHTPGYDRREKGVDEDLPERTGCEKHRFWSSG